MIEIVLGPEWDDELLARLKAETEAMGGALSEKEWAVGGSQERTLFGIVLPGSELEAEAETYGGLVLRGDASAARALARRVSAASSVAD